MTIPAASAFDETRAFLREGYRFVGNRCARLGSDVFATRILLRRVVCMAGEEAARLFYDGSRFTRNGAMPPTTLRLLQDKGSVQSLDGEAHRQRKAMFLRMLAGPALERIGALFDRRWEAAAPAWRTRRSVVLHEAMAMLLCDIACAWAGVPAAGGTVARRTREMLAMIDGAGSAGPRAWRGLMLRQRAERWARGAIAAARTDADEGPASPVRQIAGFRDAGGAPLSLRAGGVELLNLIRPTVAIARFVTFAALALHQHPRAAAWLREDPDGRLPAFVDEVRRYYPFFPVIGGRVRHPFEWRDHRFARGDWVLLGLHATSHDPRIWGDPERFRPERFFEGRARPDALVPQGAGDPARDHRCPGEAITRELTGRAIRQLLDLRYTVPEQRLDVPLDRFPTLPRDGFVMAVH